MTRTSRTLALVFSLALPVAGFADPVVQPDSDKSAVPTKSRKPANPGARKTRSKPFSSKRKPTPTHPMAKKLQAQVDRSIKQRGMVSVHAKRMEQTIRRSAATRLWAESLRRKLSQNTTIGKDKRKTKERALARADEESRPIQERRKGHKAAQNKLLLDSGFSPDRQLSAKLVGQIKEHNRRVSVLHRILLIAAQQNDYASVLSAETILEHEHAQFTTFLKESAKTDAPIVSAKTPNEAH